MPLNSIHPSHVPLVSPFILLITKNYLNIKNPLTIAASSYMDICQFVFHIVTWSSLFHAFRSWPSVTTLRYYATQYCCGNRTAGLVNLQRKKVLESFSLYPLACQSGLLDWAKLLLHKRKKGQIKEEKESDLHNPLWRSSFKELKPSKKIPLCKNFRPFNNATLVPIPVACVSGLHSCSHSRCRPELNSKHNCWHRLWFSKSLLSQPSQAWEATMAGRDIVLEALLLEVQIASMKTYGILIIA